MITPLIKKRTALCFQAKKIKYVMMCGPLLVQNMQTHRRTQKSSAHRTQDVLCKPLPRFEDSSVPMVVFQRIKDVAVKSEKMRQDLSVCTFHNAVRAPPYQTSSDNRSNAQSFKTSQIETFRECKFQKSLHACPTKVHAASRHQARIHRHGLL